MPTLRWLRVWPLSGLLVFWAISSPLCQAQTLPLPNDTVILKIEGNIGVNSPVELDRVGLESLGLHTIVTETPWHQGEVKFSGPLFRDLLTALNAKGDTVRATALNDYQIDIPRADLERYPVILATRIDDQPMTVRMKGPVFVVYPYQDHPELQTNQIYERSIWQLRHLEVQ